MNGKFSNVKIKGIVSAVPSYIETNERYIEILGEKRVKKQTRMTGVKERHVNSLEQTTGDLCTVAAEELIKHTGWTPDTIKAVVLVTQTPDVSTPSTSFIIHKALGLSRDCMVFDVNLGCSGYATGIQIVSALLLGCGNGARGLLLVGDVQRFPQIENNFDYSDDEEADRMLFGSAAAATAIELEAENTVYYMEKSDGNGCDALMRKWEGKPFMDGERVFQFTINDVVEYINDFKKGTGISEDQIDFYVFHQAQKFILKNLIDLCDIEEEKVLFSLEKYGNTSSASIPLTLCANKDILKEKEEVSLLMCGYGIGLACGIVHLKMDTKDICMIIETDKHYE